jgi:hypothetical protein
MSAYYDAQVPTVLTLPNVDDNLGQTVIVKIECLRLKRDFGYRQLCGNPTKDLNAIFPDYYRRLSVCLPLNTWLYRQTVRGWPVGGTVFSAAERQGNEEANQNPEDA